MKDKGTCERKIYVCKFKHNELLEEFRHKIATIPEGRIGGVVIRSMDGVTSGMIKEFHALTPLDEPTSLPNSNIETLEIFQEGDEVYGAFIIINGFALEEQLTAHPELCNLVLRESQTVVNGEVIASKIIAIDLHCARVTNEEAELYEKGFYETDQITAAKLAMSLYGEDAFGVTPESFLQWGVTPESFLQWMDSVYHSTINSLHTLYPVDYVANVKYLCLINPDTFGWGKDLNLTSNIETASMILAMYNEKLHLDRRCTAFQIHQAIILTSIHSMSNKRSKILSMRVMNLIVQDVMVRYLIKIGQIGPELYAQASKSIPSMLCELMGFNTARELEEFFLWVYLNKIEGDDEFMKELEQLMALTKQVSGNLPN